jgi:hypothetical protein
MDRESFYGNDKYYSFMPLTYSESW